MTHRKVDGARTSDEMLVDEELRPGRTYTVHSLVDDCRRNMLPLIKQQSFKIFCENVFLTPGAAWLPMALARGKTDTVLAIKRSNGTYTTSAEEKATTFHYYFCLELVQFLLYYLYNVES